MHTNSLTSLLLVLIHLRVISRAQIRALLNPEQQQRFDAHAAQRDARRSEEERQQR